MNEKEATKNERRELLWFAYCHTCHKDVDGAIPNGTWIDAAAKLHMDQNEGHVVTVGYRYGSL